MMIGGSLRRSEAGERNDIPATAITGRLAEDDEIGTNLKERFPITIAACTGGNHARSIVAEARSTGAR